MAAERTDRAVTERGAADVPTPQRIGGDALAQASITIDEQGRAVEWSSAAETMFGWSRAEALGKPLTATIVPPFYSAAHTQGIARLQATGRPTILGHPVEVRASRRDGSEIPVQLLVTRAGDAGGGRTFTAVLHDISRARRADQLAAMQITVSRSLMETADLGPTLVLVLETVAGALGADAAMLWLPDAETAAPRLRDRWSGSSARLDVLMERAGALPMPQMELMRQVWQTGLPFVVEAGTSHGNPLMTLAEDAGLTWVASFPLGQAEPGHGSLVLLSAMPVAIDEEVLAALGSVGSQLGQALGRRDAEDALRESERQYRGLFESTPDPILVCDPTTRRVVAVNTTAVVKYGYSAQDFLRMHLNDLDASAAPGEMTELIVAGATSPEQAAQSHGPYKHRLADGRVIDVEMTVRYDEFRRHPAILILVRDVTEQLSLQRELWHQAFHDSLTSLANRALFMDRLTLAITRTARTGTQCAVLLFDLDDFKAVNDSLGHYAGDELLRSVALRIVGAVRPHDTVARLGGDEFGVLLDDLSDAEAERLAQRIINALDAPFLVNGMEFSVRGSIGIATTRDPSTSADDMLRNADLAMYVAKAGGKSRHQLFAPSMHSAVVERVTFEQEIRHALDSDELVLLYQPVTEIATGQVVGAEALIRWQHPTRGMLSPDTFIPLAEETGLIHPIGLWVLATACAQAVEWSERGLGGLRMAVNVSGRELMRAGLAQQVRTALRDSGLPPSSLELEITETATIDDSVLEQLEELRRLGVRVAIDDFGTGYSMLKRLQLFPVDKIKIDKSFVDAISLAIDRAPLVGAMITLGQSLGLQVVAEGVENPEQLAFLRRHGCDQMQGYLVSRPIAGTAFEALARRARAGESIVGWKETSMHPLEVVSEAIGAEPDREYVIQALLNELRRLTGFTRVFIVRQGESNGGGGFAPASRGAGFRVQASVPIVLPDGETVGELRGGSAKRVEVTSATLSVMALFSRIIAEQL